MATKMSRGCLRSITFSFFSGTRRFLDVESLASKIEVEAVSAEQGNVFSYDACNIQFTSGTTGRPKATLLSHRSFVNNVEQVRIDRSTNIKVYIYAIRIFVILFRSITSSKVYSSSKN